MKLLVLLPSSPGPWSNTAGRYYGPMLKALPALGHQVTALAVCHSESAAREAEEFLRGSGVDLRLFSAPAPRPRVERKLRSLWRSGWELSHSDFGAAARSESAKDYDAILSETVDTARIVEDDPRTVLSLLYLRFLDLAGDTSSPRLRAYRLRFQSRRAELSTCRRVKRIRVLSQRIGSAIQPVRSELAVIPLCLDTSMYEPVRAPEVFTVGVLGSMFWEPSRAAAIHFLQEIAPRLRAAAPRIRFAAGGWRAREFLAPYLKHSDVEILDNFPDPRDAFAKLSVLVYAPPVGTGMKVKVLEAMAYGVPAVVNGQGFEGFEADARAPLRIARTNEQIIDEILSLYDDSRARERAITEGRECLERSFSPAVVAKALAAFLSSAPRQAHS